MKVLIEIVYYFISITYIASKIKKRIISPLLIFIISQTILFYGTIRLVDLNVEADKIHLLIMLYSLIVMVCCDFIFGIIFNLNKKSVIIEEHDFNKIDWNFYLFKIIFLSVFSIFICGIYFYRVGYNVFIVAIKSLFSDSISNSNIVEMRLNSYSAGRYLGAGYVYQFRNIILPLITIAIYYLSLNYKNKSLKIYSIITLPLCIVFSLGTGQRGGFVMCLLMMLLSTFFIKSIDLKTVVKFFIIFFILFSIISIALGRTSVPTDASFIDIIWASFNEIIKRVTRDNQGPGVVGFRYIYNYTEIQYGRDWFNMLKDILPGRNNYTPMATRIFALMHGGSTRGTSPPSIWGSVWYNWGPIGILIMPVIIGFAYSYIYNVFVSRKSSIFRVICFSSMFVILGFWIADGPFTLINSGLVTIIIMYYVIEKLNLKNKNRNKQII